MSSSEAAGVRDSVTPAELCGDSLLDAVQVANLLNCSKRHVFRLADSGKMPRPVRLGSLVRWRRVSLIAWISDGCVPCKEGVRHV